MASLHVGGGRAASCSASNGGSHTVRVQTAVVAAASLRTMASRPPLPSGPQGSVPRLLSAVVVLRVATAAASAVPRRRQNKNSSASCSCGRILPRGACCAVAAASGNGAEEAQTSLPSDDFSDPLAKALEGGPPLRISSERGIGFDFAAAGGSSAVGSRVVWGLFKEPVRPQEIDSSAEAQLAREALRDAAARNLVNIDQQERWRRGLAGAVFAVVVALLAAVLLWFQAAWYARLGVFPLVALAYGYILSAQEGL